MSSFSGEEGFPLVTDNILYELVCNSEWKEENEETSHVASSASILSYVSPQNFLGKKPLTGTDAADWLKNAGPPWQFAVSFDGKRVAVLQSALLETRSIKDNFATVLGKCPVLKDPLPGWRCMAWSTDSALLAVSFTNGTIVFYDIMASQLSSVRRFTLPSQEEKSNLFAKENALVGLFFSNSRVKKNAYPVELISVDGKGLVKCYRQTSADQFVLHHEGSFRRNYPRGINAAALVESHGLIIIAGNLEADSSMNTQEPNIESGITAWRLVNDAPYYSMAFSVGGDTFRMDSRSLWSSTLSALLFRHSTTDTVFKLVVSQDSKYLAALHVSGTISCWHLPSLKLYRHWSLKSQFQFHTENPRFNNRWRLVFNRWHSENVDEWRFFPFDINWWNETALVVSRINGCTSLLSTEEEVPTKNLLGDSPEMFESPVSISQRHGKGFFCMECEIRLKVEERRDANGQIIPNPNFGIESLNVNDNGFFVKNITQEVLFWLTDSERFRPPRRRKRKPIIWRLTHRLFCLRSITPLELFHQKIDAEEYGEALDLAKVYNLDPDLVYQRQWSRNTVSIHSINDYLRKIKKRNWVLQECLERVPDNIDAARELLQFGLKGTDLSATVMISQGRDKGEFISWTPDDLDIPQEEFLLLVDPNNLEVKLVLKYRKQFLYFLDILDTYELMLGGPRMAEENFDGTVYAKLRCRSPAESAVEMAKSNDISGLRIILTHHWEDIEPYYLQVLSSFPETTNPHDYRDFLPEVDQYGGVLLWNNIARKDKDWCEEFLHTEENQRKSSLGSLYSCVISVDQVVQWYEKRIKEIEELSGIVSHALDLTRLGIQRNITGLSMIQDDLETVETLVYDVGTDITLEKLEELAYSERLDLIMSSAKDDEWIHHFKKFLVPFLQKCNDKEPGARFYLLDQYLSQVGEKNLKKVLQVMENSKPGSRDPIVPNLAELMKLAYNCIYACHSVEETENILAILNCLPERNRGSMNDSLKEQHDAIDELELHYQGAKILKKYNVPMTLARIREVTIDHEYEEKCLEIFKKLSLSGRLRKPPMKIAEWKTMLYDMLELQKKVFSEFPLELCFEIYVADLLKSGTSEIINLARDFFDKAVVDQPNHPTDENRLSKLMRRVSSAYSTSFALYLYQIPFDKSLQMILDAAQTYYDSASSYSDPDIDLAKVCLNLMQDLKEPQIAQMFDLIDAVKLLNKDFRLEILPLTVRLSSDRIALVKTAMDNQKGGYKKIQQLLKLVLYLHPNKMTFEEAESLILDMAGSAALVNSDLKFCSQICTSIVAKGYQTGWKMFVQLAKDQSEPPVLDHDAKLASINYALNMCPNDEIFNVLTSKYIIEMRSLQSRVVELSPRENTDDIEGNFIEEEVNENLGQGNSGVTTTLLSLNPMKLHQFVSATSQIINLSQVKGVANVVKSGGDVIFQGAKSLLKTTTPAAASEHVKVKRDQSSESEGWEDADLDLDMDEFMDTEGTEMGNALIPTTNITLSKESYPMIYFSDKELGSPFFHSSSLYFKYDSFSDSEASLYIRANPSLELCLIIDKLWHLERVVLQEGFAERNAAVVKQLVLEILPEDIPLGLAILFSIKETDTLEAVFADLPNTPLALSLLLYSLSVMLQQSITSKVEGVYLKNPNQLISETEVLIEKGAIQSGKKNCFRDINDLIRIYKEYKEKLMQAFG